eukprot:scaffold125482_cov17-Tisochrysis_lutea.AAC.1
MQQQAAVLAGVAFLFLAGQPYDPYLEGTLKGMTIDAIAKTLIITPVPRSCVLPGTHRTYINYLLTICMQRGVKAKHTHRYTHTHTYLPGSKHGVLGTASAPPKPAEQSHGLLSKFENFEHFGQGRSKILLQAPLGSLLILSSFGHLLTSSACLPDLGHRSSTPKEVSQQGESARMVSRDILHPHPPELKCCIPAGTGS